MSYRRRILNLVMSNELTGVYSLHRVNLLSSQNNLFYPTAKAAQDAAAAKDPAAVLFPAEDDDDAYVLCPSDDNQPTAEESLEKVEKLQVPPPRLSFQPTPDPKSDWHIYFRLLDCAALSESRTLFVDRHSRVAFCYDAAARRVVTMPTFPEREESPWGRVYFPIAGDEGDGGVYVMDTEPQAGRGNTVDDDGFKFHAMVHRKRRWHLDELPRPPYVDHAAYMGTKRIISYAVAGGAAAGSGVLLCVSTEGLGTYCFDTASRAWTKAAAAGTVDRHGNPGIWLGSFAGKIERDGDLGIWLGFLKPYWEEDHPRLCATSDLFADEDRRLLCCMRDDCRDLKSPWGWHKVVVPKPQVVGLGAGRFCVTQFFETMRSSCSRCGHEEVDKRFAVFTGVEVIRRGSDELAGDGCDITVPPTELRVIIHKSKRYMLTQGNTIEFVL